MSLQEEITLEDSYVMPTFARKKVEFVEGTGMRLKDAEGKTYLDFLSGIGVCGLGHCHPAVVEALQDQAAKLMHVSNYYYIEKRGEVAKTISELLNSGRDETITWKSFFANSGAEANECAIKLARLRAKQGAEAGEAAPSIIVTIVKSFHGRTLATLAATAQRALHEGFEPIPEGFLPTQMNNCEALEQVFERVGNSICAVMLEPIQGESGVHVCTDEFLKCARRLTEKYNALLIFDEVQCGTFRTGKPFAFQNYSVVPDVVTMAKAIGSGMPAAVCAAREDVADLMTVGKHGSTFGGSNLAIAAIEATLTEMKKPGFAENVLEVGDYMQEKLADVKGIMEVRGIGLMVGAELADGIDAPSIVQKALDEGLVINATGPHTLRFLPPLICTKDDVDEFIEKLTKALSK